VRTRLGVVLAHQGGWDEILLIVGPMAIVVLLLRLAKRRVDRTSTTMTPPSDPPDPPDPADRSGR
jgi:hypothetical protein